MKTFIYALTTTTLLFGMGLSAVAQAGDANSGTPSRPTGLIGVTTYFADTPSSTYTAPQFIDASRLNVKLEENMPNRDNHEQKSRFVGWTSDGRYAILSQENYGRYAIVGKEYKNSRTLYLHDPEAPSKRPQLATGSECQRKSSDPFVECLAWNTWPVGSASFLETQTHAANELPGNGLYVMKLDGRTPPDSAHATRFEFTRNGHIHDWAVSPDHRYVAYTAYETKTLTKLHIVKATDSGFDLTSDCVVNDPYNGSSLSSTSVQFSPDGRWLLFLVGDEGHEDNWRLMAHDLNSSDPCKATARLLVATDSFRDMRAHTYSSNADRTAWQRYGFTWSPDSKWVYFSMTGEEKGVSEIYRVKLLGGPQVQQITTGDHAKYFPAVSPDGCWVSYVSLDGTQRDLKAVPTHGGPEVTLALVPEGMGLDLPIVWRPTTSATRCD